MKKKTVPSKSRRARRFSPRLLRAFRPKPTDKAFATVGDLRTFLDLLRGSGPADKP